MVVGGDLLNYAGKMNDKCISVVAFQVLYALKYCHEMNIVHRDVKSDNILMFNKCSGTNPSEINAKLADWGLSTLLDPDDLGLRDFNGSDDHMAPEMIKLWANPELDVGLKAKLSKKKEVSEEDKAKALTSKEQRYNSSVDIWALGCMIYNLFAEDTPF